jgi:GDP-L-fucose synthase
MSEKTSSPTFWKSRTVLVTGGNGFLGRNVVDAFKSAGATVIAPTHKQADLTLPGVALELFKKHKPSHVVHLAARVGGIGYNQVAPAPLYLDNLLMGTHTIEAARIAGVEKTVLLGTDCSYPKKALLVHAQVNAQQYGQKFAFLIPTNLFGPGDKFHPDVSHVIPALIKKCVEAKEQNLEKIDVWGTGSASRDYLYVKDAARAILLAGELHESTEPLNLGNNREITIRETAETIARIVDFTGELVWDSSRPDGQPRRRVDASRAERELGWHASTDFEDGLHETVKWFLANRQEALTLHA